MTVTAPDYSARILGTPNIPVSLKTDAGRLDLDSSRAPHASASVQLAIEDPALLADLDPRQGRRVEITAGGRVFDLGIRAARPDRTGSTVSLDLASDEALLGDFAQLVDDYQPYELAASLRAVVNYVLGAAIPGAALQAGTLDADVTPHWRVVNLHRNPAVVGSTLNYTARTGCTIAYVSDPTSGRVRITTTTAAAGEVWCVNAAVQNLNAKPGEAYNFGLEARTVSGARAAQVGLVWLDSSNAIIATTWGNTLPLSTTYRRLGVSGIAPDNAVKVGPLFRFAAGTSGQQLDIDGAMLWEGNPRLIVPPFSGASNTTPEYSYEFQGQPDDSPSVRIPVIERDPESVIWKAGQSALEFLAPLVQVAGFRLVCDEQRRWTLRNADYRTPGTLQYRYGVNIVTSSEDLSRESEAWFDGAVFEYRWTDNAGIERVRVDSYALPGATKIVRREVRAAFPGPGRAKYAVERAQGRGRTVTATKQATWKEHAEQTFSALLDGTPIQLGVAEKVTFDLARNEVTVTSHTTDTPAGAIDLLTGTINGLTGTINSL